MTDLNTIITISNVLIAIAVAVFTGLLVRVGNRQWRELKRSVDEAKKAADAAKDSAEAAKKSAETLPRLERAYLFLQVTGQNLKFALDMSERAQAAHTIATTRPTVQFTFKNHGKTPALLKELTVVLEIPNDIDGPIEYTQRKEITGDDVIPAGGETQQFEETVVPGLIYTQTIESIRQGRHGFRFFGRVVYEDIFQQEHETRFFWVYYGSVDRFQPHRDSGKPYNLRT